VLELQDYQSIELRHQGLRAVIYAAMRRGGAEPVILKAPRNPQPTRAEVSRLLAEYEIATSVNNAHVIRFLDLVWHEHRPVAVIEDFGGRSLAETVSGPLELQVFFQIATQIVEGLAALHARRVIHKDLNPSNILFNPETGAVKLADFSISTMLAREAVRDRTPERLEGTLPYISPEQTGRMNRSVDYRTDFYSLGVTFFELLAGRLPYDAIDPLELVYSHIARTPAVVTNLRADVPDPVAGLVAKLLSKTAEERYQSVAGLRTDLERCADQWAQSGTIATFALGKRDGTPRFQIPEKLYGRSRQLDRLWGAFYSACDGNRQLLTITGHAGIGKSALVHEIQRPVVERRGIFVSGKFDQLQRDIPNSAFLEAIGDLLEQLLTRPDSELTHWRERLREELGDDSQVLVEALPLLELVIGPQKPVAALPPVEAEHRFNRLMRRFFRAFASADHPLVLFLDDLQWADSASLRLLELLLGDDSVHHLLIIGAYRTEGVNPTHALSITLDAVARGPVALERIELGPLQPGHVAKLLAETLRRRADEVHSLAEVVHRRTLGNPFFVNQFVQALYADRLFWFDENEQRWCWDGSRVVQHAIAEDVVSFLLQQMRRLPEQTRHALELAACIGARFDLGSLAIIAEQQACEVAAALRPALDAGIVLALDGGLGRLIAAKGAKSFDPQSGMGVHCAFVHDRFQQAAYSRIPEQRRGPLHLRLARLLCEHLAERELDDRLFEVVNHFVAGQQCLADPCERLEAARLNYRAGLKAKTAAAYDAARRYFRAGIDLLPADRWESHYRLAFELYIGLNEAMLFNLEAVDDPWVGAELLRHATNSTDHMRALGYNIIVMARRGEPERALELGLSELRAEGLDLTPEPLQAEIESTYQQLKARIDGRSRAQLVEAPEMSDPRQAARLDLIRWVLVPMFMRRRELVPLAEMGTVRISLDHGVSPLSGMGYAGFARVAAHVFDDFKLAYELAQVGKALCDRMGLFRAAARGLAALGIEWVRDPLGVVLERAEDAFRLGVERGEPFYPALLAGFIPSLAVSTGRPLDQVYQQIRPLERFVVERVGDIGVREVHLTIWLIEALRGERPWRTAFFADAEQEKRTLEVMRVRNVEGALWYHLQASRLAYWFGELELAREHAERAYEFVDMRLGLLATRDLHFHHALVVAGCATVRPSSDDIALVEQKLELLERWVRAGASANFRHKCLLVRAELARLVDDWEGASAAYEEAIAAAGSGGFIQDQALANELAARFYISRGLDKVARVYLNDARYGYEKWGATAKVEQLIATHRGLAESATGELPIVDLGVDPTATIRTTMSAQAQWLDFNAALKASRAISSELVLDALLEKLLAIVAENAGAERALLLLRRERRLIVEAVCEADGDAVELVGGLPLEKINRISAGVVNYVARTQQAQVLDDAAQEGRFRTDPYISRRKPRSILCAPLSTQGRLVGVVYLENNLTAGAFTPQRLELVNLLSAQAAISIEQARLYSEVERTNKQLAEYSRTLEAKVEQRTRDLAEKNEQLNATLSRVQQMQNQLVISEKMASLGNLVAGVAHEINTPMGAIVSSIDTSRRCHGRMVSELADAETLEQVRQSSSFERMMGLLDDNLGVVQTAAERVSEIVRTLRNFARLDEAERKPADLHQGIEGTLTLARHRLGDTIRVVREFGELPTIHCYPNQINQVFMNLLVNAIDAIEERQRREGTTGQNAGVIRLRTRSDEHHVHVQVTDNGIGIESAALPRIFDPGYTTKGVGVGTGLGLSICFNIAENHGGRIDVESEAGQGTSATFTLPRD
jgi:predicted ATPase/signal transduction histidine kinase